MIPIVNLIRSKQLEEFEEKETFFLRGAVPKKRSVTAVASVQMFRRADNTFFKEPSVLLASS